MVKIDPDRLLTDLKQLRSFGATGPGVVRLALSPVDLASRRWLAGRMAQAGLDAVIDGVGTVFGRSRKSGPALVVGSHTDTQPTGGWLDGAMGVIYGLEIARALGENE
ncbi:MAG: beta-ureidopropionase / N-carbamoyl-L-amino-acid hydrolase, partial [Paraburkholderia sp.]|nr:beta-ureidopropionase / N-carbamoyl-L-amino-acid hydrolase [Paraburkholderia sp.]